jgi:predicted dehydrogenase
MTNIGLIGCGQISRFHYEGYEQAGARIAHVCDLREETARAVGERYGARVSTDYRALLDDPRVQLVSVLTTASTHREICLAAIAAGKGVVCEKTLSDNPVHSAEIARAAQAAGIFCATAYMKRFFPAFQQAQKMLADMGPVTSLYARTWQPFRSLWDETLPAWTAERPSPPVRSYGGGALVCGGSHILDLVHWYGGRPRRVCAHAQTREGLDFDRATNALLWLPGGAACHFEAHWHPLQFAGYERNGWDERLEINTPAGRLDLCTPLWHQPERNPALLVHQEADSGRVTEYRFPAVNAFHAEMAEMLRRFETGEPPAPSAWDGYVVDELIATITESARTGQVAQMSYADEA